MAFVVAATWKAKPGEEERIREVIRLVTPLSRNEPGNLFYQAQVSSRDPAKFFLYEQYTDAQAYEDHKATEYFRTHVLGYAIHYLESREVETYETIEG
ncbi:putative quinol monooxygenase [Sideroxydans sp. CL21]|uniref:putative quinol monooxygenase n=1 Tax=Sideroxydans sp. CL21 TaxID=2600596 RepID=UPI0024BCD6BE|nr:putative quinol monooxygenase [Sideroxydans sp. CL21]